MPITDEQLQKLKQQDKEREQVEIAGIVAFMKTHPFAWWTLDELCEALGLEQIVTIMQMHDIADENGLETDKTGNHRYFRYLPKKGE